MRSRAEDLTIFLEVVDQGGFSAAANSLDIQVAKVSRSIGRLEAALETKLLNRTTRKVMLTDEGEQFIEQVRQGLHLIESAENHLLLGGKSPKGRLRVDAASPFVLHQLVPLMNDFAKAYPEIQLELSSNETIVDLIEKKTDIAIRIGRLEDSTLKARRLGTSSLHLVASPQYLAAKGLPKSANQLLSHQLIGFVQAKNLNRWPMIDLDSNQLQFSILATNGESIRQLALTHNGIACLSNFMVAKDIEAGKLVPLLTEHQFTLPEREEVHAVYYPSTQMTCRIQAFLDFVQPRLTL